MRKIYLIIRVAIMQLAVAIRNTKNNWSRLYTPEYENRSRMPMALAKALGSQKPLAVIEEGKFYRVIFKTGKQSVYSINKRRGIATLMF